MKRYAIYNFLMDENENIKDRFDTLVKNNKKIDNFYYSTIKEAYEKCKHKLQHVDSQIVTILYEEDDSYIHPYNYRIVNKYEIFSDFPKCKVLRN